MVKDEVELTNGMQNVKTKQGRRKKRKITLGKTLRDGRNINVAV